jgi:hypothetical protein
MDLTFDWSASRQHAVFWFKADRWWIEDTSSTNGTVVDGEQIRGKGPTELTMDSLIVIGATTLRIEPSWRHRLEFGELVVEVNLAPALNYSLVHCRQPLLSRVVVRNVGAKVSRETTLRLLIPHFGETPWRDVRALQHGESCPVEEMQFQFDKNELELHADAKHVDCVVELGSEKQRIPIHVLAANEWSTHALHRKTLASFVVPSHPLVQQLLGNVNLSAARETEEIMRELYDSFRACNIEYRRELLSFDPHTQRIRLPHQVFPDARGHRGAGTCIDLVALFASCLEGAEAQPILILLQQSEREQHALLGCWRAQADRRQLFIHDKKRLLDQAFLVECTGFAHKLYDGEQQTRTLTFDEARRSAIATFTTSELLYALDVWAARKEDVRPLPFAGGLRHSASVSDVMSHAREEASRLGQHCTVLHLLWSLLRVPNGLFARALSPTEFRSLNASLGFLDDPPAPERSEGLWSGTSEHFDETLAAAHAMANHSGSHVVDEGHIVRALLAISTPALQHLLDTNKIRRDELTQRIAALSGIAPPDDPTLTILTR